MKKYMILILSLGLLSVGSTLQADNFWDEIDRVRDRFKKWTCVIDSVHVSRVYTATRSTRSKAEAEVKQKCAESERGTFWCGSPDCSKD